MAWPRPAMQRISLAASGDRMGQLVSFQEILRRLAIIDEGFVEDQARLGPDLRGRRRRM
jgi:hypothetical protein